MKALPFAAVILCLLPTSGFLSPNIFAAQSADLLKAEPVKASIHSPGSKISELVRGRKVSVVGWGELEKVEEYTKRVFAAFGFPSAAR